MYARLSTYLLACALVVLSSVSLAHVEVREFETVGVIDAWASDRSLVRVNGIDYRVSATLTVSDRVGRALGVDQLKQGRRVLLRMFDDLVVEVIVEPSSGGSER